MIRFLGCIFWGLGGQQLVVVRIWGWVMIVAVVVVVVEGRMKPEILLRDY